jgi:hypothetical protein
MKINTQQAADILRKTPDELLFIVQDGRLNSYMEETETTIDWVFELDEVLEVKKELDEGLDGQLRQILLEEG